MGVVHRTIFTWFNFLVFLILVVLRVDGRTQWNWLVVFIPLWVFNVILLIYAVFRTVQDCKSSPNHLQTLKNAKVIIGILLLISFEIMLCFKMEYSQLNLPLTYVMIPLWIILPVLVVQVFFRLMNYQTAW